MSAPQNNANALKHGLTASRHSLTIGNMPKKLRKVERLAFAFRRELEVAVIATRGEITLMDAATIQTAVRLETSAQLAKRWLMEALTDLSEGERLAYLREIGRQSVERDRCLRHLGLDTNAATTIDALYSLPAVDASEPGDRADDEPGDDASGAIEGAAPLDDLPVLEAARDYQSRVG